LARWRCDGQRYSDQHLFVDVDDRHQQPEDERRTDADRIVVAMKGPASDLNFEIFFSRDASRTPLLVRVPLALGTFSMELVR